MRASLAGAANRAIPRRMRAWLSISLGSGLALLLFACATGNTSFTGTGLDEGDPDGATLAPKPVKQDGSSPDPVEDAAPPVDSSVAAPDSAPPKPDSGPPTGSGDCVGQISSQLGGTYDDACDAYYFNTLKSNPCAPGGSACAALNTSSLTFCCYKPLPGSYCEQDYAGTPQCLPK